jgi:hypothetical protein
MGWGFKHQEAWAYSGGTAFSRSTATTSNAASSSLISSFPVKTKGIHDPPLFSLPCLFFVTPFPSRRRRPPSMPFCPSSLLPAVSYLCQLFLRSGGLGLVAGDICAIGPMQWRRTNTSPSASEEAWSRISLDTMVLAATSVIVESIHEVDLASTTEASSSLSSISALADS